MYEDKGGAEASSAGGWEVSPEQVRGFAAAVEQVRADLTKIHSEVDNMSTPNYAALLGTSPVGQELADKFSDRMGSDTGLRGQLKLALDRMDEFVASAEKTATGYQQHDEDSAGNLRYSG